MCVEGRVLGVGRGLLGVSVQCLERSRLSEKGRDVCVWGGDKMYREHLKHKRKRAH